MHLLSGEGEEGHGKLGSPHVKDVLGGGGSECLISASLNAVLQAYPVDTDTTSTHRYQQYAGTQVSKVGIKILDGQLVKLRTYVHTYW